MIIWLILLLVTPGIIATCYFYRITGLKSDILKQLVVGTVFTFAINFLTTVIVWFRGHEIIYWSSDNNFGLISVQFTDKIYKLHFPLRSPVFFHPISTASVNFSARNPLATHKKLILSPKSV